MNKTYSKFFSKLKIIKNLKFIFNKPTHSKILIFDSKGATTKYYQYFYNQDCIILDVLGETINIFVLFKLLIKFKTPTLKAYIEEYIRLVKPEYIFHNSYNWRFFEIDKKKFDFHFIKIFTQSELKNQLDFEEFVKNINNLNCDYLFVWSQGMKQIMSKYIKGEYIICGAFENNNGPKIIQEKLKNKLLFVSQYRTFKKNRKKDTIKTIREVFHGLKFSWEQFHQAELDVAFMLKEYCNNNNIEFGIVGTSINDKDSEKKYFADKLGENDWTFIESAADKRGIYLAADARFVVTIDSTLGYECLARGQRVSFFSVRGEYLKAKYARFGWPLNLQEEGPCWTTKNTKENFNRLIDFLVSGSDENWNELRKKVLNNLLFYNPKNEIYFQF